MSESVSDAKNSCVCMWFLINRARVAEHGAQFSIPQSCLTLYDPMDCSPPGTSVHGDSPGKKTGVVCHALLQGIFPTRGSNPGLLQCRRIVYHLSHQGSLWIFWLSVHLSEVAQSCPALCDPVDRSPPGSSVHGISQARTLEWFAIPFSRGSSQPGDRTQVSCIAGGFFIN